MSHFAAAPEAIRAYGLAASAQAAAVAAAGAIDQTATVAAATPVFGLIGQDFLAAFAIAQANHMSSVLELAGVYEGTALTAHEAAAAYVATEVESGGEFLATVASLA
ncbi:type VII secretion target [Nocardia huaxiensis]|uniref:Excreted virulence factor EspC (Type VII ESX diderm) n=1 Tax=Nocardia huaxiensis TaxID=2755382 RepID=A0A7D6VKC4_9NOCA|nr:type VII secretion target [Nocardia huaxiensis]QLY31856.1 hypothetical protein H0264_05985 [Nocardia huaxiensis]UFS95420.1 hypothetical protein LPY97_32855 [Nocardia huaxiensis]